MLRPLVAAALSFVIALPMLGASPHGCARHEPAAILAAADGSAHAGMDMAGMAGMPESDGCDECAPPADNEPPCDHANMTGECATMPSCATPVAEVEGHAFMATVIGSSVEAVIVTTPSTPSRTPEPPPPRA